MGRAVAVSPRAARRIDPRDGKPYGLEEFEAWYGGRSEWDKAKVAMKWRPVSPETPETETGDVSDEEEEEPQVGEEWNGPYITDRGRYKVDDFGNFWPHPAVSVICPVLPSEGWINLAAALHAVAGHWVSPVSPDSYHITVIKGPSQLNLRVNSDAWRAYLYKREKQWKEVRSILKTTPFRPRTLRLTGFREPERGWGVCASFEADDKETSELQDLREQIRTAGLRCGFETRNRGLHVNFAYARRAAGVMPPEVFDTVCRLIRACVERSPVLPLGPACLCFSPNAGMPLPWDGTICEQSLEPSCEGALDLATAKQKKCKKRKPRKKVKAVTTLDSPSRSDTESTKDSPKDSASKESP